MHQVEDLAHNKRDTYLSAFLHMFGAPDGHREDIRRNAPHDYNRNTRTDTNEFSNGGVDYGHTYNWASLASGIIAAR